MILQNRPLSSNGVPRLSLKIYVVVVVVIITMMMIIIINFT